MMWKYNNSITKAFSGKRHQVYVNINTNTVINCHNSYNNIEIIRKFAYHDKFLPPHIFHNYT